MEKDVSHPSVQVAAGGGYTNLDHTKHVSRRYKIFNLRNYKAALD